MYSAFLRVGHTRLPPKVSKGFYICEKVLSVIGRLRQYWGATLLVNYAPALNSMDSIEFNGCV